MMMVLSSLLPSQRFDDTTPQVRDAACEVIATLLKALGDRPMVAYVEGIDKTKMAKASDRETCPFPLALNALSTLKLCGMLFAYVG